MPEHNRQTSVNIRLTTLAFMIHQPEEIPSKTHALNVPFQFNVKKTMLIRFTEKARSYKQIRSQCRRLVIFHRFTLRNEPSA